jgi:hypothetical protein
MSKANEPKLRFSITAVLATSLYSAAVFATLRFPTLGCSQLVYAVYGIGYAVGLIAAYHTVGPRRAFWVAFAAFGFAVDRSTDLCPGWLATGIGRTIASSGANLAWDDDYYVVEGIVDAHSAFVLALVAGAVSSRLDKSQADAT